MPNTTVTIVNKLGLHARATAKLVTCSRQFESRVTLRRGDREVSGKSMMGLMMLAAGKGTELELETEGADAEAALEAVAALIADRFGEDA
ncbi:HPr family phosphocarrier protein [Abyssibacter sp.]|jgi:phosphocarrier protein|uniref:HPr family phosphocarrier protein n=1 Tax=Abyssibacter sp. TaxID=2320200 RepID=UPI000C66CC0F|nr:HPr family phosphocarrier protein [Abyssibacter sp.]MBB86631.1 phosphocarrier protein HPr [Xanthomonadales bacterium]MCK5860005.1 HPr family phosphocarrier protein [Abyssibacter sp.]